MADAAENAFAERAIPLDKDLLLFEQNEKNLYINESECMLKS
jgi:hypothetical protein